MKTIPRVLKNQYNCYWWESLDKSNYLLIQTVLWKKHLCFLEHSYKSMSTTFWSARTPGWGFQCKPLRNLQRIKSIANWLVIVSNRQRICFSNNLAFSTFFVKFYPLIPRKEDQLCCKSFQQNLLMLALLFWYSVIHTNAIMLIMIIIIMRLFFSIIIWIKYYC